MRTDCEFYREHRGHELNVPGKKWPETVGIFWMGSGLDRPGTARCPLCEVEEEVIVTQKICEKHPYGRHIKLVCGECGETGSTKNIKSIGARSIFVDCECDMKHLRHECDELAEYEKMVEDWKPGVRGGK